MKKSISLFALLILCAALLVKCSSTSKTSGSESKPDETVAQSYTTYCSGCHGKQLQQFKTLNTKGKDIEYISGKIVNGYDKMGMPAFGHVLSEQRVNELANYIKSYDYSSENIVDTNEAKPYEIEVILDSIGIPWGMAFLPNGDLIVSERQGVLTRLTPQGEKQSISGLPKIWKSRQGGLLDIVLHPDYESNSWIYIAYSYQVEEKEDSGGTAIVRAKIQGNTLTDLKQIYEGTISDTPARHFGCRMVFDREGYLYFSNGDRAARDVYPQKLDNTNGKIHRLHDDGRVPEDNPFVDQEAAVSSIYSYGHRNPQGLALHPLTGEIWEHEHGPKGGDEINVIQKGKNYGWPVISYGINYDGTTLTEISEKEGMEQPIHYYVPSIAPCGMTFITSDIYPGWKNSLLIGSLSFRYLERVQLSNKVVMNQEKLLTELDSRVRNVKVSPDGYIYVGLEGPGRIIKLLPKTN